MSGNESHSRGKEPSGDANGKNGISKKPSGTSKSGTRPTTDPEKIFRERTQDGDDRIVKIKKMQDKTMSKYSNNMETNMKLMKGVGASHNHGHFQKNDNRSNSTRTLNKKPTPLSLGISNNNTTSSLHDTFR